MVDGEDGEDPKKQRPDDHEEEYDEQYDGPCRRVLAGPEVPPVATEGCGEEVILEDDGDEEPLVMVEISTRGTSPGRPNARVTLVNLPR